MLSDFLGKILYPEEQVKLSSTSVVILIHVFLIFKLNIFCRFGVCCLFIVTSTTTTIDQNCTYIQNPSFPSVYSSQTALTYTINKCSSNVCAVRLDFETFSIQGPALTTELGACTDMFTASGTSGQSSPVICGLNTDQHCK